MYQYVEPTRLGKAHPSGKYEMKIDRWVLATVGHWLVSLVTLGLVPSAAGHHLKWTAVCTPAGVVRLLIGLAVRSGEGGGCCPPLTSDRGICVPATEHRVQRLPMPSDWLLPCISVGLQNMGRWPHD